MKLATWNLNSVRVRGERLLKLLERHQPDVLCLQELKCPTEAFPSDAVQALGYHAVVHGQRTYNGVAILSRDVPHNIELGFGDDVDDPQARIAAVTVCGIRVLSVYVPNGGELDSDKFQYKLRWLERLQRYLTDNYTPDIPLVVCGDLNIAPHDIDVARPAEWSETALCVPAVREAFRSLEAWGLIDLFRHCRPDDVAYSWWDYRMLGFPKNNGLRIDHLLATASVAGRCVTVEIDRDERKGKQASDHAPVLATLDAERIS